MFDVVAETIHPKIILNIPKRFRSTKRKRDYSEKRLIKKKKKEKDFEIGFYGHNIYDKTSKAHISKIARLIQLILSTEFFFLILYHICNACTMLYII